MNSWLLKSFTGISEFEDRGIAGAFKFGTGIKTRKKVDSLSCQQGLVEEGSGVIADLIHFWVPSSDGNTYGFGDAGKIYKRASNGTITLVYTDTNGAINGAWEWTLNTGKTYLFWATSTRLNCKEIPGASDWSDVNALASYPKTNLTAATWHTMTQTVGSLKICNADYLAGVGYDGSYSNSSLRLYYGSIAQTILERKNYAVVGAKRKDAGKESAIHIWDTISDNYNDKQIIPDGELNAMIDTEVPLVQVGSDGAVYFSDMVNLVPLFRFPGGGKVNPGGVTKDGGLALFGVFGAATGYNGIYSYGRIKLNQERTLNLDYPITCDEIGAIVKTGSDLVISYKTGSTPKVVRVDTTAKQSFNYFTLDSPASITNALFPELPLWDHIVVTMQPLPANCSVEVWYRLDKTGDFIQARMEDNVLAYSTENGKEAVFLIGEKAKTIEFWIKGIASGNTGPEINRAEVFFE